MKHPFYSFLAALCLYIPATAQVKPTPYKTKITAPTPATVKSFTFTPITVPGVPVPDMTIHVEGYPAPTLNVAQTGDQLLILDFWATWCAPCRTLFAHADSLKKRFGDQLLFLPVTYEPKTLAAPVLAQIKKQHDFELPQVFADQTLVRLFPHRELPHEGMEDLTQSFFYGQKYNYTLMECYNMLDGRAAYREQPVMRESDTDTGRKMVPTGDTYWAWRALNFKEADANGNFLPKVIAWKDHAKELDRYPIKGLEETYVKQRVVNQLERGNLPEVTLLIDGHEVKARVNVNAPMLRLDFVDENGQKMEVKKVYRQALEQSQKTEMSPQDVQRAAKSQTVTQREQQPTQNEDAKPEKVNSQQLMQSQSEAQKVVKEEQEQKAQGKKNRVHLH